MPIETLERGVVFLNDCKSCLMLSNCCLKEPRGYSASMDIMNLLPTYIYEFLNSTNLLPKIYVSCLILPICCLKYILVA